VCFNICIYVQQTTQESLNQVVAGIPELSALNLVMNETQLLESDTSHSVMHRAEVVNAHLCIFTTTTSVAVVVTQRITNPLCQYDSKNRNI
jgi:hypothetical protein